MMENDYQVALSYAHEDKKIAEIIKKEFTDIFVDQFFMDVSKPEELANAEVFEEKLRNIFQRTKYSVILYSKNYYNGTFTLVEQSEIMKKEDQEKESKLFIININDYEMSTSFSDNFTYTLLNVLTSSKGNWIVNTKVREQLHDIIHNKIKRHIMERSIKENINNKEYSLNIHTLFPNGNVAYWKKDYNWNLIGSAYIDEDGRKIRKGTDWEKFWTYIEEDFIYLKKNLEPDIMWRISFNCHLSIAYKLGAIYGELGRVSGNRNLELVNSNGISNTVFTIEKNWDDSFEKDFNICTEYEGTNCKSEDIVCIISIKPNINNNILKTVRRCLEKQGQEYRKLYLFQEEKTLENVDDLKNRANYLRETMNGYIKDDIKNIHLFLDTAVPLIFAIGAKNIACGKIQLYEYIPQENNYYKSLIR